MLITTSPHDLVPALGTSTGDRAPGLHMSDIYGDLYQTLEPERYVKGRAPNPLLLAMGLAWEEHVERTLIRAGHKVSRPAPRTTPEGVVYSPDLLFEDEAEPRIGEIKLTTMSVSEEIRDPKFSKWVVQAMSYCHHWGTPYAAFLVLFTNGDYKQNRLPMFRWWDVEFSARELQDNWAMLLRHARLRGMVP